MKSKFVKDRKSGSNTLVIKPTKRERFEYEQAEWLLNQTHANLVPFRYELEGDAAVLYYDVTGLVDLKTYVKASLGLTQYIGLLVAVADVLALCTKHNFATSCLQFDRTNVFVQPDGTPRFVFVPLSGVPAQVANTPLGLLEYLGDTKCLSFVSPEDTRHAHALFDYVKRNKVLSLSSYRAFLSDEFKAAVSFDGASGSLVSGSLGASGGLSQGLSGAQETTKRGGAVGQARSAFDPVALLKHAPSASEVKAQQSLADRVRDGVGDISPTASARLAHESAPAAPPAIQPIEPAASPVSAVQPIEPAAPSGSTMMLGSGVFSHMGSSAASDFAPTTCYLERVNTGERYLVEGSGEVTIGRSASSDIHFSDNTNISRTHALLRRVGASFEIVDLGSSNGTFVQGRRLSRDQVARILLHEEFKLADEVLRVVSAS